MASGVSLADEGDEDDSSSSQIKEVLSNFREAWKKEITAVPGKTQDNENQVETIEEKAQSLFLQGVHCEQQGRMVQAIRFYRTAMQLVPDIEFKTFHRPKDVSSSLSASENTSQVVSDNEENTDNDYEDEDAWEENSGECLESFLFGLYNNNDRAICQPTTHLNTTHISALPHELILYILRWVVGADLDFRSLESFGIVSRGFLLCSRDETLWRLGCFRIWGHQGISSGPTPYDSWRRMLLQRPRPRFDGCYISQTSYIRPGESGFQDTHSAPWHLVRYFRYLRFFPGGEVLMLTTPEEPASIVGVLKGSRPRHHAVLRGRFVLRGSLLGVVLRSNARVRPKDTRPEQSFHLELDVRCIKGRPNWQLQWCHYSIVSRFCNLQENSSNFDLNLTRFPPFWFSRVRSYTMHSQAPLN